MLNKVLKIIIAFLLFVGLAFMSLGLSSGKHKIETSIEINAPIATVYDFVLDEENSSKWLAGYKSSKLLSGEEGKVGSKYEMIFDYNGKEIKMYETITHLEENKKYAFELNDKMIDGEVTLLFEPTNNGTKVTEIHNFQAKGFVSKAMNMLVKGMIKKGKNKMYKDLKASIESEN